MLDYNWLFSATAQCSATIVAILGGFIASRLLTINSERRELLIKIRDLDEEIRFKESRIDELEKIMLNEDMDDFIKDKLDELLEERPIEDVFTVAESRGYDIEDYRPGWENALATVRQARCYFAKNPDKIQSEFDDIAKKQLENLYDLTYEIWEKVYKNERIEARSQTASYGSNFPLMGVDIAAFDVPSVGYSYADAMNYRDNNRELGAETANVEWLKKQRESFIQRKKALTKPNGMGKGIFVFVFFSIIGIVFPIALMPFATGQYMPILKWVDIGLFVIGLFSVVWYLISFLKADAKSE